MSITLTLSGNNSILTAEYFPPLDLLNDYVCGLIDFHTYNSIPNVDLSNNLFHIGDEVIQIPVGSYEVDDIANFLHKESEKTQSKPKIRIQANNNTLKTEIKSTHSIYFDKERSIGQLLGFSKTELKPSKKSHESDLPVNITKVNAIRIECNLITGSYINDRLVHTLHEFSPDVGPGYKITEVPKNVIYLPVNVKRISSVVVKVVDQDGNLINFRGENITLRLHLKPK